MASMPFRRGMLLLETLIRAQISQFEPFELILLLKLDKQFPVEQFEAAMSQSTVPSPPLKFACVYIYIYIYMYVYVYVYVYIYIYIYAHIILLSYLYVLSMDNSPWIIVYGLAVRRGQRIEVWRLSAGRSTQECASVRDQASLPVSSPLDGDMKR